MRARRWRGTVPRRRRRRGPPGDRRSRRGGRRPSARGGDPGEEHLLGGRRGRRDDRCQQRDGGDHGQRQRVFGSDQRANARDMTVAEGVFQVFLDDEADRHHHGEAQPGGRRPAEERRMSERRAGSVQLIGATGQPDQPAQRDECDQGDGGGDPDARPGPSSRAPHAATHRRGLCRPRPGVSRRRRG